jgi:hypothetical protein
MLCITMSDAFIPRQWPSWPYLRWMTSQCGSGAQFFAALK